MRKERQIFWSALLWFIIGFSVAIGIRYAIGFLFDPEPEEWGVRRPLEDLFGKIYEHHMRDRIAETLPEIFPGWQVYDEPSPTDTPHEYNGRPKGVEYYVRDGDSRCFIDILAKDPQGCLVVIELKRTRALPTHNIPDTVNRYMELVDEKHKQGIRGLVIAQSFHPDVLRDLQNKGIEALTYEWQPKLSNAQAAQIAANPA